MFITIDGYSGAGKSTQLHLVAKRLNLQIAAPTYHQLFDTFLNITSLDRDKTRAVQPFALLQSFHVFTSLEHNIVDHFWDRFYLFHLHNPHELRKMLNFFRNGMAFNNRHEPGLSIFIDVPLHVAILRRTKRDTGQTKVVPPAQPTESHTLQEFWSAVESEVPYFRRIDGNQSVTKVTKSIITLIEETSFGF